MKIYDRVGKRLLNEVTLFLTPAEAAELADSARDLVDHPEKQHHHVSDRNYEREVILAVYTRDNISEFDDESKKIIGCERLDDGV